MPTREHTESPPIGREMSDNECRCRIREASTARLRVLGGAPTVLDVTYSVTGNTFVLDPSDHERTDDLGSRRNALLEIDSDASETTTRWRVVVTGPCEPVGAKQAELLELRIEFLEGRHGDPEALPPGSLVPPPRRAPA